MLNTFKHGKHQLCKELFMIHWGKNTGYLEKDSRNAWKDKLRTDHEESWIPG